MYSYKIIINFFIYIIKRVPNFSSLLCFFFNFRCDLINSLCDCICFVNFCCFFIDFINFCCDFNSYNCVFGNFCCDFMDFINFCCDLLAKSLLFLRFKFSFIVDNNFLVVIPLFCANNLIKSSDSSAVKFKLLKLIKSILILDYYKRLEKNDLELIKISYFLAVF